MDLKPKSNEGMVYSGGFSPLRSPIKRFSIARLLWRTYAKKWRHLRTLEKDEKKYFYVFIFVHESFQALSLPSFFAGLCPGMIVWDIFSRISEKWWFLISPGFFSFLLLSFPILPSFCPFALWHQQAVESAAGSFGWSCSWSWSSFSFTSHLMPKLI